MAADIDLLLTAYERGRLSRRQLLGALGVIGASTPSAAQRPTVGIVRPSTLDHVNLLVADPARTEAFYRKLFGFPPSRLIPATGQIPGFDLQGSYVTFQKSETPGRIDHFCIAVEGPYDIKAVASELEAAGLKAPTLGGATSGYIVDPDGIRIQFWPTSDRLSNLPFPPARG
jgi:catechol 2,3-dioxygenase-like lactoylglutathione lyase family enzyme